MVRRTGAEYLKEKVGESMEKDGKKFRVLIIALPFQFSMTATTIYEAYEAINVARKQFNLDVDMDKAMETLVMVKNGQCLERSYPEWGIEVVRGSK